MSDADGMKKRKLRVGRGLLKGVAIAVIVGASLAWGFGAGRVRSTGYSTKQCFNPSKIYKLYKARQFEKRLAGEIYDYRISVGGWGSGAGPDDYEAHARASDRIFGGDGLAEFNGQEGMQAEEYVLAIKKITGKYVRISQKDISNPHGLDIMNRFIHNVPTKTLEEAAINWNSHGEK